MDYEETLEQSSDELKDWVKLADKIRDWGKIKEISNPYMQMTKLSEESGELASELCRGRMHNDKVKDALGDIGVVWIILADMLGYYAEDCLTFAWEQIKDRKGKSVNGGFVKNEESEGLTYQQGYSQGVLAVLDKVGRWLDEDTISELKERFLVDEGN